MVFLLLASTLLFLLVGVFAGGADDPQAPRQRASFLVYFLSFHLFSQWHSERLAMVDLGLCLAVIVSYLAGVGVGRLIRQHFNPTR
jgi:hypothetical membrane protein